MVGCSCFRPGRSGRRSLEETVSPDPQTVPESNPAGAQPPAMLGRILAELTGEDPAPVPATDPERLKGLSSPPEEDEDEGSDPGLSGVWRAIPFLPSLVEAIVGTPYEEEEEEEAAHEDSRSRRRADEQRAAEAAAAHASAAALGAEQNEPVPLRVDPRARDPLAEPSSLLRPGEAAALATLCPTRHRLARWQLAYSTLRDGISMQTMLRMGHGRAPTVLVVRDMDRNVMGAFCSEPWRTSTRFYGTGETFVFQLGTQQVRGWCGREECLLSFRQCRAGVCRLAPYRAVHNSLARCRAPELSSPQTFFLNPLRSFCVEYQRAWRWWTQQNARASNDYFMWGDAEGIAVGGSGGYAIWLDADFAKGLSRSCLTFGSPPLVPIEEFDVGAVELWWLR
uniref:Oxidation resistance protein 1 n=1 Tax=Auxenochlorella protothecoides TaxID=3075 RepID=A0A1D2A5A5_AUXPR